MMHKLTGVLAPFLLLIALSFPLQTKAIPLVAQAVSPTSVSASQSISTVSGVEEEHSFTESLVESISNFLRKYLPPEAIVFVISLLPILELRGGMIVARLFSIPWLRAVIISIIGNMIPVPFIIFFIERILRFLKDHGPIKKLARAIEEKGMKKGRELMEKYPKSIKLGLFLFVAIPLPGTGAWTGSLIAALMGLKPKESAPYICLGVLGASAIMSVITYVIPWVVTLF